MKTIQTILVLVVVFAAGALMRYDSIPTFGASTQSAPAAFFNSLAQAVESDKSPITTTEQFRNAYRAAVPLAKQLGDIRIFVDDGAISDKIAAAIGKENKPLTPELKQKLADVLRSVAAAY